MLYCTVSFSRLVVVIEDDFRLFVFEELQGNEREAFVCHEHIDTAEGAFQPLQLAESLFQIGSEGEGLIHFTVVVRKLTVARGLNTEKENPSVLRRMDNVYCSDLLKSVVSIIRLSG